MKHQPPDPNANLTAALHYCEHILPHVSRTFALNIKVLQGELYRAVLAAYLFCRIVDTVEDSESLSPETQASLLLGYRDLFAGGEIIPAAVAEWRDSWGTIDTHDHELDLIANCDKVFTLYQSLQPHSRDAISACVIEMADGMRETLLEKSAVSGSLRCLTSLQELEQYCYYVAGTVGKMLTRLFSAAIDQLPVESRAELERHEISFALGLQMTNIIKDCASDYQRGWCYIPAVMLQAAGASPRELLAESRRSAVLGVLNKLILLTADHLEDALRYTLAIPADQAQIRLFNLWSLLFAIATLGEAYDNADLLDPGKKVKVPREAIASIMEQSRRLVGSDNELRRMFELLRGKFRAESNVGF